MSNVSDCPDVRYDVLQRLRDARGALHAKVTSTGVRERVFSPVQLMRTLHEHVEFSADGTFRERYSRLFALTVLLYGALDWHYAGHGIDIEADVQLERIRQDYIHGGPVADDRLSAEEWRARLQGQLARLEQQVPRADEYAIRLVKLTGLAQAALEAVTRQSCAA